MTIPIFVILIGLLGILVGPRVSQWWQRSQRRRRDIDQLVEQFQALFRQLDQEKHSRP
jgi:xanthosine utilization system XapX-like protein